MSLHSNAPATPALSTLSLHDALPILDVRPRAHELLVDVPVVAALGVAAVEGVVHHAVELDEVRPAVVVEVARGRSEEHTSELQSPCNLVCRLLLEKKKHRHSAYAGWN